MKIYYFSYYHKEVVMQIFKIKEMNLETNNQFKRNIFFLILKVLNILTILAIMN
jgi:hypothetical protein